MYIQTLQLFYISTICLTGSREGNSTKRFPVNMKFCVIKQKGV